MADKTHRGNDDLISNNRRARFDYELGKTYEAGLSLMGSEVKMMRLSSVDLSDAWCTVSKGQVFLHGANVPVAQWMAMAHEPKRARRLLLHAREIEELARGVEREGMTIAVTKLYFKGGRVKAEIALARGKKKADKRESVKERDAEREARQAMASARRGNRD